jgi:crotonobetainyl-CoA:carnitine CoA-transferase CaiB-like acyl-CoA transferase
LTAPYQAFQARDGWRNIRGANQANRERIADVLGHPEWRDDERSARPTHARRMGRCVRLGRSAGLPVHDIGGALSHPQTFARGMVVDLVHSQAGPVKTIRCPLRFSATPTAVVRAAPLLGEHTRELLREHDYSDLEIERFVAEGVVETVR